jgi:hypothetical protein
MRSFDQLFAAGIFAAARSPDPSGECWAVLAELWDMVPDRAEEIARGRVTYDAAGNPWPVVDDGSNVAVLRGRRNRRLD